MYITRRLKNIKACYATHSNILNIQARNKPTNLKISYHRVTIMAAQYGNIDSASVVGNTQSRCLRLILHVMVGDDTT